MSARALEQRILDFVHDADTAGFGDLALALFAQQFESLSGYRKHCETLGVAPAAISDWREIPAVDAGTMPRAEPLESSPSRGFRHALLRAALADLLGAAPLWLVIDDGSAAEGNAAPLIDMLAGEAPQGSFSSSGQRLDAKLLRSWLGARQRDRRPALIIAAPSGYLSLTQLLERRSLKFRLPPGSAAFGMVPIATVTDTGTVTDVGDVGDASSWSASLAECLGLYPEACRRVICGPASSTPLVEVAERPSGSFRLPHWVRARVLDSARLAILDLASLAAPAHRIERVTARVDTDSGGDRQTLVLG